MGENYWLATKDHKSNLQIDPRSNLLAYNNPRREGKNCGAGHYLSQTANFKQLIR